MGAGALPSPLCGSRKGPGLTCLPLCPASIGTMRKLSSKAPARPAGTAQSALAMLVPITQAGRSP